MRAANKWRVAILLTGSLWVLQAQGTKTRPDPSEYSSQSEIGSLQIAADLLGHNISLNGLTLGAGNYLVVEVALFGPSNLKVPIDAAQFTLKVNGQRYAPVSPGVVTVGYLVPDMRQRGTRVETAVGAGPMIVTTGRDPNQPKFPGDTNPADKPFPRAPQTADEDLRKDPIDPVKAVSDAALPEGLHATPVSGYLFYSYAGKLKSIRHAELEYSGPLGNALLALR